MTKGLLRGSEVIARRDFEATTTEHLSFFKGDILTIVDEKSDDKAEWYRAQDSEDKIGLVPISYLQKRSEVSLNPMPWFHGKITREEAEHLLQPPKVSTIISKFDTRQSRHQQNIIQLTQQSNFQTSRMDYSLFVKAQISPVTTHYVYVATTKLNTIELYL